MNVRSGGINRDYPALTNIFFGTLAPTFIFIQRKKMYLQHKKSTKTYQQNIILGNVNPVILPSEPNTEMLATRGLHISGRGKQEQ